MYLILIPRSNLATQLVKFVPKNEYLATLKHYYIIKRPLPHKEQRNQIQFDRDT